MSLFEHQGRPNRIGVITHGSLKGGIEMKLDAPESIEAVEAGTFVVIQGEQYDFFSMITDVEIEAANEAILLNPPGPDEELLRRVMQGTGTYATVELKPMLMMPNGEHPELSDEEPRSVKTIPTHFSVVAKATEDDVARVFGHEANDEKYFSVGSPLGMEEIPVCVDLDRFVERSNAVFGKTGTGKTFITRLITCGLIRSDKAVNLIFDMHSEYGLGDHAEDGGPPVRGLKQLFPHKVVLFSLDPKSTRERGASPDQPVYLYADQIEPEDILPLQDTLSLNETAAESCFLLRKEFGRNWLRRLLEATSSEIDDLADRIGAHPASLGALKRKLGRLERYDFFKKTADKGRRDVLEALMENIDAGRSIVFEFGRYDDLMVYLLVANVITRRIRQAYEKKTNAYRQSDGGEPPKRLMITIEEAHKFLTPDIAHETPFGKIAREMRKYFVSLLVVDQRPSAIDDEVLSQIGTKIVAKLNDEKDIANALVGTSDASSLRQVLASLDQKQQALLLGHAVPMPIVVRTRTYGEDFYRALRDSSDGTAPPTSLEEANKEMDELFY